MMMINVLFINLLKMMTIMMSSHLVKHAVPDGAPLTEHVEMFLIMMMMTSSRLTYAHHTTMPAYHYLLTRRELRTTPQRQMYYHWVFFGVFFVRDGHFWADPERMYQRL